LPTLSCAFANAAYASWSARLGSRHSTGESSTVWFGRPSSKLPYIDAVAAPIPSSIKAANWFPVNGKGNDGAVNGLGASSPSKSWAYVQLNSLAYCSCSFFRCKPSGLHSIHSANSEFVSFSRRMAAAVASSYFFTCTSRASLPIQDAPAGQGRTGFSTRVISPGLAGAKNGLGGFHLALGSALGMLALHGLWLGNFDRRTHPSGSRHVNQGVKRKKVYLAPHQV